MGAIRGIFLVLVSVLLFLSIFSTILFSVVGGSLKYETLESEASTTVKQILVSYNLTNSIQEFYPVIQLYCQNNSNYVFSTGDYTFNIPCNIALQGNDAILNEGVKSLIHQVYYANYNCNFLDCAKNSEVPLFLVSEKAYNFFTSKFYLLLAISSALIIIFFLLVKKKTNAFIVLGTFLLLFSLLFFKLNSFFSSISDKIVSSLLQVFFSNSFFVALVILIAGIVLIIMGIIFKIFHVGFSMSDLISKLKKKEVSSNKEAKTASKTKSK
jgi:hypothetical protein